MMNQRKLWEYYRTLDAELKNQLNRSRAIYSHPTLIGDAQEYSLKRILDEILASRFATGSGTVMDLNGEETGQIDIIIHDGQTSPIAIGRSAGLYFVESVLSLIEVKTCVRSKTIKEIQKFAERGKSVTRNFSLFDARSGDVTTPEYQRFYEKPMCIVFAYESQLDPDKLLHSLAHVRDVDAVFVLDVGSFYNFSNLPFRRIHLGADIQHKEHEGWVFVGVNQEGRSVMEDLQNYLDAYTPHIYWRKTPGLTYRLGIPMTNHDPLPPYYLFAPPGRNSEPSEGNAEPPTKASERSTDATEYFAWRDPWTLGPFRKN